jgi:hypothetical protein
MHICNREWKGNLTLQHLQLKQETGSVATKIGDRSDQK